MFAAQLLGFVRQVSHGMREVLTKSEKIDYFYLNSSVIIYSKIEYVLTFSSSED